MNPAPAATAHQHVTLITGATAGLGASIARELVRARKTGAIVLVARRQSRLDELGRELQELDPSLEVLTLSLDLAETYEAEIVVHELRERFGGLNLLINNAGLGLPTLFADANPGDLRRQIAVNFTLPLLLTRLALPDLIERQGMIINIGSAITTVANSALGAYGATKAGLAYWNDALRRELRFQGVRVCLVEPGPIRTEFSTALAGLVEEGSQAHPVVNTPSAWMTADVTDVAQRIVRLIDRPRRRLSVQRRVVWPLRTFGAALQLWPALGDHIVTRWFGVDHKRNPTEVR